MSKGKDVLNENVLFSEVENELLKDSKKHFLFAFSTRVNPEWQIIKIDETKTEDFNDKDQYYYQDF